MSLILLNWSNKRREMSALTEAAEDYLEAILALEGEKKAVRVKDIAGYLKVKDPSVVVMVRKLQDKELVTHEPYGYVELTEKGLNQAESVYQRHKAILNFLHNLLGIDAAVAEEDACKIEHHLHPETLKHILKFIEFVETCPEGDPMWLSNFQSFLKTGKHSRKCQTRKN
jgi:DtxR family Mn-dependent transcriptional regulator